jgi:hypothetical protein
MLTRRRYVQVLTSFTNREPWGRSGRYMDFDGNVIELTQHT